MINKKYCKGCQICIEVCPKNVFSDGSEISEMGYSIPDISNYEECIDFKRIRKKKKPICELCILTCPDQAITEDLYGDE